MKITPASRVYILGVMLCVALIDLLTQLRR